MSVCSGLRWPATEPWHSQGYFIPLPLPFSLMFCSTLSFTSVMCVCVCGACFTTGQDYVCCWPLLFSTLSSDFKWFSIYFACCLWLNYLVPGARLVTFQQATTMLACQWKLLKDPEPEDNQNEQLPRSIGKRRAEVTQRTDFWVLWRIGTCLCKPFKSLGQGSGKAGKYPKSKIMWFSFTSLLDSLHGRNGVLPSSSRWNGKMQGKQETASS